MSTTTSTRNTPTIGPLHVSPRLRPPPQTYHGDGSRNGNSPRKLPQTPSSLSNAKKPSLIDPFLEQYIRPSSNDHHELYFKSLNRQVRIKSFDYYQQYLNQVDKSSPGVDQIRQLLVKPVRKPRSPLLKELELDDEDDDDDRIVSDVEYEEIVETRRRRHPESEPPVTEAPSKKSHPQIIVKSLPPEFMNCAIEDLIELISRMLHSLIGLNDRSVPMSVSHPNMDDDSGLSAEQKKKLLTRYHSRTPPAISIETYLSRLTKFNNFTQTTMLTTIYYIDLLSHNFQPYFTLNSWTVHRFLLVATMLAQKSLEDFFYTNDHYAKVGGVALTELNCLELDFLNRVNWKLVPAKQLPDNKTSIRYYREVLDLYYRQLVTLMGTNTSETCKVQYSIEEGVGQATASRL